MSSPVLIRSSRPYSTEEEFLAAEAWSIGAKGMVLLAQDRLPPETVVRFELSLDGGDRLIRAEGRVYGYLEPNATRPGGLKIRFKRFDAKSQAFIRRAVAFCAARSAESEPGSSAPRHSLSSLADDEDASVESLRSSPDATHLSDTETDSQPAAADASGGAASADPGDHHDPGDGHDLALGQDAAGSQTNADAVTDSPADGHVAPDSPAPGHDLASSRDLTVSHDAAGRDRADGSPAAASGAAAADCGAATTEATDDGAAAIGEAPGASRTADAASADAALDDWDAATATSDEPAAAAAEDGLEPGEASGVHRRPVGPIVAPPNRDALLASLRLRQQRSLKKAPRDAPQRESDVG